MTDIVLTMTNIPSPSSGSRYVYYIFQSMFSLCSVYVQCKRFAKLTFYYSSSVSRPAPDFSLEWRRYTNTNVGLYFLSSSFKAGPGLLSGVAAIALGVVSYSLKKALDTLFPGPAAAAAAAAAL